MSETVNLLVTALLSYLMDWTNCDIGRVFAAALVVAVVVRAVLQFFRREVK